MIKILGRKSLSRNITGKILLVFMALLITIGVPMQLVQPALADQYDDKIAALQQDIAQFQTQAATLNNAAITLQTALDQLSNQKAAIQAQIDISQAQYDQLVIQIAETEQQINDNQDALGKTIANMYVDDQITPLEMLASSRNIGDYLNKQEYRSSVRDQLTSTIAKIKDLKIQLDKQQTDVKQTLTNQQNARDSLAAREIQQQNLLSQTQGQESAYQQLISNSFTQITEARAIQAAINRRGTSTGGYKLFDNGLLPDYITDSSFGSWNDYNCPIVEVYKSSLGSNGNGGDNRGYGCRQCASYVAWKIYKETGNFYPDWGDAVNFTSQAQAKYGVGDGKPHAGSIAVLDAGASGHVAWVESEPYINNKGQTVIRISQYNFEYGQGYGMYSLMEISVNFFDHYVQIIK